MEYLTTEEAAERLGLSKRQVQALIKKGHLPAEWVGDIWLLKPADVETFQRRPVGRPKKMKHDNPS